MSPPHLRLDGLLLCALQGLEENNDRVCLEALRDSLFPDAFTYPPKSPPALLGQVDWLFIEDFLLRPYLVRVLNSPSLLQAKFAMCHVLDWILANVDGQAFGAVPAQQPMYTAFNLLDSNVVFTGPPEQPADSFFEQVKKFLNGRKDLSGHCHYHWQPLPGGRGIAALAELLAHTKNANSHSVDAVVRLLQRAVRRPELQLMVCRTLAPASLAPLFAHSFTPLVICLVKPELKMHAAAQGKFSYAAARGTKLDICWMDGSSGAYPNGEVHQRESLRDCLPALLQLIGFAELQYRVQELVEAFEAASNKYASRHHEYLAEAGSKAFLHLLSAPIARPPQLALQHMARLSYNNAAVQVSCAYFSP